MNKELLKKLLPYIVAIVTFIAIAVIYCYPVLEGKVIRQADSYNWKGMFEETAQFHKETGKWSFWSGSMFSGMPNFQTTGNIIESQKWIAPLFRILHLGITGPIGLILMYLICFFILLRSFNIDKWLSIIGSIAITLSSYFFIIIEAGHNAKADCIALMAPVIAGFFLIFNKKYIWGILFSIVFIAITEMTHPQMIYYFFLLIGCLFIAEIFIHFKEKRYKDLIIATLIFACAVGVGIGTNYSKYAVNSEYLTETMRGGHSEIVKEFDEQNKVSEGLDLDYATAWSYGIDETMTLLIPNFKGASSQYQLGTNSKVYEALIQNGVSKRNAEDFCRNVPTYWGTQPFTSGPVYVGAIIVFLFILGLFIVKGPYKWALLVATLFSILLSWGNNFMPLTKLFFEYFPMYNKFRAVSSILVVAEVTMPLLGFLAIKDIVNKKINKEKIIQFMYISGGITAGICLIFALFGGWIFNFTSPNDAQLVGQLPEWLMDAIVSERASMMRMDAWRSLFFIAVAFTLLWLFVKEKLKFAYFVVGLGLFILIDMWGVDKRFFNADNFVTVKNHSTYFKKLPYEEYLLQDPDPNYRVMNLTTNTFNESRTSYYFKSIGGYHGAKLRRYQDLINEHISKMNMPVLDMLNTKYFIVAGQDNQPMPQMNPNAMGNAWFVDSLLIVDTPNEESDALNTINLRNTAVLDRKFAAHAEEFIPGHDSTATVQFLTYNPDTLTYQYSASKPGVIVFSEIYYPYGWKAFIDDQPIDHFRVNYTLRALNVPAGEHHIKFVFHPDKYYSSEKISYLFISIMYASIIGAIIYCIIQYRRKRKLPAVK